MAVHEPNSLPPIVLNWLWANWSRLLCVGEPRYTLLNEIRAEAIYQCTDAELDTMNALRHTFELMRRVALLTL